MIEVLPLIARAKLRYLLYAGHFFCDGSPIYGFPYVHAAHTSGRRALLVEGLKTFY